MKGIKFDFNGLTSANLTKKHGITAAEIESHFKICAEAHKHLNSIFKNKENRENLGLEWAHLPFQNKKNLEKIKQIAKKIKTKYDNVISLGIGGSYLGLKAAQDALCPSYYNEFKNYRNSCPKIFFEGNNLDPGTLKILLSELNPKKTFVIVISKSGETTETKAAFEVVEYWLKNAIGPKYGRNILAVTDAEKGSLRQKVNDMNKKDSLSFMNLPVLKGVGGRFSEFNIGLLHLAVIGVDINALLNGAAKMYEQCSKSSIYKNPAYMYALLHFILYKKGKDIAVMMPFSESLKSTADWYCQLLAESLGKKYKRKIQIDKSGNEIWLDNKKKIINTGRTPVACRGTNDLHSVHQNNVEGLNNKVTTFIRIEKFISDIMIPKSKSFLSGCKYSELLKLAQEATEWSMIKENRPNCTVIMPEINAYTWGQLLFFFEMATAFEGELLEINAFNQPGVESYKNYMFYKLDKPGISDKILNQVKKHKIKKSKKFLI